VLCSKFSEPQDCAWISSGDETWKRDLSNDLDRVEYIEKRLQELSNSDFGDPDGDTEKAQLTVRGVTSFSSKSGLVHKHSVKHTLLPMGACADDLGSQRMHVPVYRKLMDVFF
jgi:hypothetical protein